MGLHSKPGFTANAGKRYVWKTQRKVLVVSDLVSSVGAILYTSYLQTLGAIHSPSAQPSKRPYPPPSVYSTFFAGSAAGAIQSLAAAPLDALQVRFQTSDMLGGTYNSTRRHSAIDRTSKA